MYTSNSDLPIISARTELIKKFKCNETTIILGETGSGKTTQIPQFIFQEKLNKICMIACTQPRRVAAISIATKVAVDMGCQLGTTVGYNVRFEEMTSQQTKIIYLTDGMLLREALLDPLLNKYSFIILDEAHERTLNTDILFGVVKSAQNIRNQKGKHSLNIIVMSATMDVDAFSMYFNNAPILYVEGRLHDIQIFYTKQAQQDYARSALISVLQIHKENLANEDILVFMTGQEEIESMAKILKGISKTIPDIPMFVYPLFSSLPSSQQIQIFKETPKGSRKVIISTNVAETSITIGGIKHVIDTGFVKSRSFDSSLSIDLLKCDWISKAQAWQRTGRAGRESDGICYRLYTEQQFDKLKENTIPEIMRCNLSNVVLQLLIMGIKNVVDFDYMDKPPKELIINGIEQLHSLCAIESIASLNITDIGRKMAAFPLEPRLSKVILSSQIHHCLEEVLTIVSMLCTESILHTPTNKKDEAQMRRLKFQSLDGDHFFLLNIYRAYKSSKANQEWCKENFINVRAMKMVKEVRKQLKEISQRLHLNFESCGHDCLPIKKSFCAGFFSNASTLTREGDYITVVGKKRAEIHPGSTLFRHKPQCVVFTELVETTNSYMRNVLVVDEQWLKDLYVQK